MQRLLREYIRRVLREINAQPDYTVDSPWGSPGRDSVGRYSMNTSSRFDWPTTAVGPNVHPEDMVANTEDPWGELSEEDDLEESAWAPWGGDSGESGGSPSFALAQQSDLNREDPPGGHEAGPDPDDLPGEDARDHLTPTPNLDEGVTYPQEEDEEYLEGEELDEDGLMLDKPGTIVEPDVRHSIKKYFKAMGLAPKKKR